MFKTYHSKCRMNPKSWLKGCNLQPFSQNYVAQGEKDGSWRVFVSQ